MPVQYEHSWSPSPEQAVEIQEQLAARVRKRWPGAPLRLIAGVDCSYSEDDTVCAAAVVVWDLETQAEVETKTACFEVRFPYIPGLLAFREVPAILKALECLTIRPQLLICDGHGVAHPRRFGLASHVGVLTGVPTIGCAKRRLCGSFVEPDAKRGSRSPLTDRGEIIGTVLRTRNGVRPVFVSVGHLIDLPTAERIVLACALRHRIPEPLRIAHRRAAEALQP
ncbi:MAG: deoxyribonuclease V [Spirochaetaceae bacterium]|nr:MAG: deoxyribonuclease V [Spirochaetaceae bacterium]